MIEKTDNPNLAILEIAVEALGDLSDSLVFVGGCATGLLLTRVRANQIRATKDVDVVTRVATIVEYHSVEARLSAKGFKPDTSPDAPICRWLKEGVTLDVMPSEPGVLSFHNRWYPLAVTTAQTVRLPSGREIKLIDAPTFIATKLEAFKGRGMGDFLVSHDIEDIITVVDGRPTGVSGCPCRPSSRRFREPSSPPNPHQSTFRFDSINPTVTNPRWQARLERDPKSEGIEGTLLLAGGRNPRSSSESVV